MELLNWLLENWAGACQFILAAYGLAVLVVILSPTKKDDAILDMLSPILSQLEEAAKKINESDNTTTISNN